MATDPNDWDAEFPAVDSGKGSVTVQPGSPAKGRESRAKASTAEAEAAVKSKTTGATIKKTEAEATAAEAEARDAVRGWKVPEGYRINAAGTGLEPIPGGPKAGETILTEEQKLALRAEAIQKLKILNRLADSASKDWFVSGLGAQTVAGIGGTAAADAAANIETVTASGALAKVMEMAKANGGKNPLTPLSEGDFRNIGKSISNLAQSQSVEQFKQNLDVYRDIYTRVFEAAGGSLEQLEKVEPEAIWRPSKPADDRVGLFEGAPPAGGTIAGEDIEGFRFSGSGESQILDYARGPDFTPEGLAELMTQQALDAGGITPDQAEAYRANALAEAQQLADKDRSKLKGLDYSKVDRAASENAGFGDTIMNAASNVPESAVQLIEGLTAIPVDTLRSAVSGERLGAFRTTTDLVAELAGLAGIGNADPTTLQALGAAMEERYGGLDNIKRTFSKDPVGLLGDMSIVMTAGGSSAARVPGTIGKLGKEMATVGKMIDPLSAITSFGEQVPRAAKYLREGEGVVPDVSRAVAAAPGQLEQKAAGLVTGIPGGEPYGRAAALGYEAGRAGGPTAASENFTSAMRGEGDMDVVKQAQDAVMALRQNASQRYSQDYVDVANDKSLLDFEEIDAALEDLRSRAYVGDSVYDPAAADVYDQTRMVVDEWKTGDPNVFHTPDGMDKLKRRIGRIAGAFEPTSKNGRAASSIATGMYNTVKDAINRQVPAYASVMADYEKAAELAGELERTFSLNGNTEGILRKLQAITRNNANTSYGYRKDLAELLDRNGDINGVNTRGIVDSLQGQSLSAWNPRGLTGLTQPAAALGVAGGALNPGALAFMGLSSPRVMGELHYGAGKAAGTVARGASKAWDVTQPVLDQLYQKYSDNPRTALALAQYGSRAQEVDENRLIGDYSQLLEAPPAEEPTPEELMELLRRYQEGQ